MQFLSRNYFIIFILSLSGFAFINLSACGPAPAMLGDSSMFDPDWIIEVEVELDSDDWEVLRNQTRDIFDVFCSTEPPPNPYTYFEADIAVDGIKLESIGIRKKGFFGSVEPGRPSFKVSFNEYVRGQRFFGMRRMTLNNSRSDPAKIKQCIGYWLFDKAGLPSPRCNFAHVTVNGEDLGLYVHLESIKTELLTRYFDDLSGNLYEGALSDFQPNWVGTFQKKTNQEYPDRSDLDAMVTACQVPDDQFLDEIEQLVELDDFYTFWAMEVLIAHWDGYASFNHNNYYIYNDPQTGKFNFILWGIDGILFNNLGNPAPRSVFADSVLANRLYNLPESQAVYIERVKSLLETVWDEQEILGEIDRMEDLITPIADSYQTGQLGYLIDEIRHFVRTYPAMILAEIDSGPVVWEKELVDPPCWRELGTFSGGFTTTWGTLGVDDPFVAGSGTFNALFEGEQV
ncbi:MAG: CotH kinase family protein, partial [Deltaproteobacteria bacterium]|nr:CotH kinase family protein [Deltaproteobacteria bacterium]